MRKKLRKAAVAVLIAAVFLQQCQVVSFAEEDSTEISTELSEVEKAAAAQSEAEAAAAAQSEAEAAAAAQSEAEAAAAVQSEAEAAAAAQSEAEAAAAQSEAEAAAAAQSEAEAAAAAQSEAEAAAAAQSETEAQTVAQTETEAQTKAQTEAELQTAAASETEKASAESESETEAQTEEQQPLSARTNTGSEVKKKDLVNIFEAVLPYLFVAETVEIPGRTEESGQPGESGQTEESAQTEGPVLEENDSIPETWILDGEAGTAALLPLKASALDLANAQSTDRVIVINLYADETGTLDVTQLYEMDEDLILDVTEDCYYVMNVIADSPEQALDFYGFDLRENKNDFYYTDTAQPGRVLYNFVAINDDTYTDYEGDLKLHGLLQGTVLSPSASVEIEQDLSGAVYARKVTVSSDKASLQRIVFLKGDPDAPEPETEAMTEEPETEAVTEAMTEEPESETEAVTEAANEARSLSVSDLQLLDEKEGQTLELTAQAVYNGEVLTAVGDQKYEIGLFVREDEENFALAYREELSILDGKTEGFVVFDGLACGEYYIFETDENGDVPGELPDFEIADADGENLITIEENADLTAQTASLQLLFDPYPEGRFSYSVEIPVTLSVVGHDDKKIKVSDTFEVVIYSDENFERESEAGRETFVFDDARELTKTVTVTNLTADPQRLYITETAGEDFIYTPSYSDDGEFEARCGEEFSSAVEVTNKLKDSVVELQIADNSDGKTLSGAEFMILDESGTIVSIDGETVFNGSTSITNKLKDGAVYFLYEINAPAEYTPKPQLEFTVKPGQTTEVVLKNKKTGTTDNKITVIKSVYVDSYAVYATSSHEFYCALFEDAGHTSKVSNVKKLSVSGFTGAVTFDNVVTDVTYYVAETDQYGFALPAGGDPSIAYSAKNGKVTVAEGTNQQLTVQNTYSYLPGGYCYTGKLTLTKQVKNASGSNIDVSETFSIGLYKNADYSDTPQVVSISLRNATSGSVTTTFRLVDGSLTYYVAEVMDDGNGHWIPVSELSDFSYTPSLDQTTVTITKDSIGSSIPTVTITNTEKSDPVMSVELYLTKRVYEGTDSLEVGDTFYFGLFKDASLTELYANPIAMPMYDSTSKEERSDLTQKITMSVSATKATTIYVAEVHADGSPVRESEYSSFGYEIGSAQPIKVQYSPESQGAKRAVVLNGVYGTMSDDAWDDVYGEMGDIYGEDGIELASYLYDEPVETADETPVAESLFLMAAALAVFGYSIRRRRRTV